MQKGLVLESMAQIPQEKSFKKGKSLWDHAFFKLKRDRFALISIFIILAYIIIGLLAQFGVIASQWQLEVGASYAAPSLDSIATLFGTDIFGRSVFYKVIKGAAVALNVGFFSALIAVPIGVVLGATAGYFGGVVDELIVWFYTTVASIPNIILLSAISFIVGPSLTTIYLAIGLTTWVGVTRVIRAEFMKHKNRDYVHAAESIGATHFSIIFKHILPNVFHQIIINFTLLFHSAIKAEVILSYLGLGVQGQPSWGIMIDDARLELARGVWWQLAGATVAMFFLLLAFNIFGDALRDALDPKVKS